MDTVNENLLEEERMTLVCVTNQFKCERIIKAGRVIADLTKTELGIISVVNSQYPQNPEALDYLYKISKENRGTMNITYSDAPARAISRFIKENKVVNVMTGVPTTENSVIYKLWDRFKEINFFTVEEDGEIKDSKINCSMVGE